MKRKITEAQLHKIVSECVKRLISESVNTWYDVNNDSDYEDDEYFANDFRHKGRNRSKGEETYSKKSPMKKRGRFDDYDFGGKSYRR